jgi:hypothetical protein
MCFYYWILHSVVYNQDCWNTVRSTISTVVRFIISYCRYVFRCLFDHLQAEYTILGLGNYHTNNGSAVPDLFSLHVARSLRCIIGTNC